MKVYILLAAVCGTTVLGAPQATGSGSSTSNNPSSNSDSNKPGTRFFNQGVGFQANFPVGGGGFFQQTTIPPNTQVNVLVPGALGPTAVGVANQQCTNYCNRGGNYVCCDILGIQANLGQCPTPRPSCPPTRLFGQGPRDCRLDVDCGQWEKCCYDTCLQKKVCKPPSQGQFNVNQLQGQQQFPGQQLPVQVQPFQQQPQFPQFFQG